MSRVALLTCGGFVTAGVACGLTADFSGLQGGTAGDAGVDVTSDVAAEVGGDVAADASTPPPSDAGAGDARTDATRPDGGFCASLTTPVKLCADFDEGNPVGYGWSFVDEYAGSAVGIDNNVYYSAPASFISAIDEDASPASARLQEDLPLFAPHVHMEFELLVPAYTGNDFEVCTLHEPVASGFTYGVFYKYQDGNLLVFVRSLEDDGGEADYVGMIGPPPQGGANDGWLHVEIDTDVSTSADVVVKHDGQVVLDASGVDTLTPAAASMFVELGYFSDTPFTAIAHFDNVIIDWTAPSDDAGAD